MLKRLILLVAIVVLALAACDNDEETGEDPETYLPDLENYRTLEGSDVLDALESVGVELAQLDPESAAMLSGVQSFYQCARDLGVAEYRIYSNNTFPQSAGVALVINLDRLTDSRFLLTCAFEGDDDQGFGPDIEPCNDVWRYEDDEATYWLMYAGTTEEICTAFNNDMPRN